MHTFSLMMGSPDTEQGLGPVPAAESLTLWEKQCRVFNEIGTPETLLGLDKVFLIERRGGGHGEYFTPNPNRWYTPRHVYFQTNMRASLPADLVEDGSADTLLPLRVADEVSAPGTALESITLKVALTAGEADEVAASPEQTTDEIQIQVRVNNLLLNAPAQRPAMAAGLDPTFGNWHLFAVPPSHLAVGDNLIGIRLAHRPPKGRGPVRIEKVELHVCYG